jgi:ABC-type ATPase with predicted acetyltransferase domain
MAVYSVSKKFGWTGRVTEKVAEMMRMFGLTVDRLNERQINHRCEVEIGSGDVVFIAGPSGSGKSILLRELEKQVPASERVNMDEIELPGDRTVIDCIETELLMSLRVLGAAGLSDVFCILNQPVHLSDGQKWRFRLAMALAAGSKFVFADEFCSGLDRITAAVIAHNIYKFAKRNNVTFVLAASVDDMLADLVPDVLIVRELSGPTKVIYKRGVR